MELDPEVVTQLLGRRNDNRVDALAAWMRNELKSAPLTSILP